jgi:hypothetical protein
MDEILIERLVLDLPMLSTAQAGELSRKVGEKLAESSPAGGDFGALTVDLNEQAISRGIPHLADAVVEAIMRQIG